jgi:hypothetical protein
MALLRRWNVNGYSAGRIGRRKDGRQVKPGTYDYQGARESLGLAPSAPPQQVISAVMIDQDAQHSTSIPLKAELQRELTKALACNAKNAATIKSLQKQNETMKTTISLQKTETKFLVEDRRQLRREKRALVKTYETRLKDAEEEGRAMKKMLIEENRMFFKSFSAKVNKLEQTNQNNDTKMEKYQSYRR